MWMLLLIGAPPSTQNVWHGGRMPTLCDSGAQRQPWAGSVLAAYGESSNAFNQLIVLAMSVLVMGVLALHPARIRVI